MFWDPLYRMAVKKNVKLRGHKMRSEIFFLQQIKQYTGKGKGEISKFLYCLIARTKSVYFVRGTPTITSSLAKFAVWSAFVLILKQRVLILSFYFGSRSHYNPVSYRLPQNSSSPWLPQPFKMFKVSPKFIPIS